MISYIHVIVGVYNISDTEWAVMKYTDNNLTVAGKGKGFESFRKSFGNDDRGYGYIRIMGGDELSKRPKFIFVTWCGESVPAMQKVISI